MNYLLGRNYRKLEKFDSAELFLLRSIKRHPKSNKSKYELGSVYYLQGNYKKAIERYEQINLDENKEAKEIISECYYRLSQESYSNNNFIQALSLINNGLSYSNNYFNYRQKALVQLRMNNTDSANTVIDTGLEEGYFERSLIYFDLGIELSHSYYNDNMMDEKIAENSIKCLVKHLEYQKSDDLALYVIGNLQSVLGNNELSQQSLEKAIHYNSSDISYYLDLAEVYIKTGNYQKVDSLFENAPVEATQTVAGTNALMLYLKVVASRLLNDVSVKNEKLLDSLINDNLEIENWSYKSLINWFETQEKNENLIYISELTKRMESITTQASLVPNE